MSPRGAEHNERMRAEALERITRAALSTFARYGYRAATMRRIAEEAGLSYGLVYHYFPSKAKVFGSLVDYALESTLAAMHAFLDGPGTAWQRIERYAAMLIESALSGESSLYFLLMLQAVTQGKDVPGLPARIGKRASEYFDILAPLIARAQESGEAAEGDPYVLAAAFFAFLQGLSLFTFHGKGWEKKATPQMLLAVLKKGMA